jgi:ABC-type protease/lipase transport system fused ATPase/permease subunit
MDAARAAGIHELVLRLPSGYETPVGPNGSALAPGHRQRIALARALFRDPFLVVLDDPTASQDAEGDKALAAAVANIRARKGIVVLVAYRMNVLEYVDDIMVMRDGAMIAFGPRDETLQRLSGGRTAPGAVLKAQAPEGQAPEAEA